MNTTTKEKEFIMYLEENISKTDKMVRNNKKKIIFPKFLLFIVTTGNGGQGTGGSAGDIDLITNSTFGGVGTATGGNANGNNADAGEGEANGGSATATIGSGGSGSGGDGGAFTGGG